MNIREQALAVQAIPADSFPLTVVLYTHYDHKETILWAATILKLADAYRVHQMASVMAPLTGGRPLQLAVGPPTMFDGV